MVHLIGERCANRSTYINLALAENMFNTGLHMSLKLLTWLKLLWFERLGHFHF